MFIRNLIKIVLLFLFYFACTSINAQPKAKDSIPAKPAINLTDFANFNAQDTLPNTHSDLINLFDSIRYADDSLLKVYNHAKIQYEIEALDHRHRVFEWQLSSSKYTFIVVNIIVFVGLLLSIWQFYLPIYKMNKMIKRNEITKAESHTIIEDEEKKETHVSTIKLGKDGIEITSPVIGLLILVISITFYFLYINFVYPVSEIAHP